LSSILFSLPSFPSPLPALSLLALAGSNVDGGYASEQELVTSSLAGIFSSADPNCEGASAAAAASAAANAMAAWGGGKGTLAPSAVSC